MDYGNFSVSLNVKDVSVSQDFYQKLGFKAIDGGHMNKDFPDKQGERWRIMQKDSVNIGLFEGMFESNMFTFNPTDVRAIQKKLKANGIILTTEADPDAEGSGFITLEDPDGNQIMFDQW
jgi:lactoylglutathione lyase